MQEPVGRQMVQRTPLELEEVQAEEGQEGWGGGGREEAAKGLSVPPADM